MSSNEKLDMCPGCSCDPSKMKTCLRMLFTVVGPASVHGFLIIIALATLLDKTSAYGIDTITYLIISLESYLGFVFIMLVIIARCTNNREWGSYKYCKEEMSYVLFSLLFGAALFATVYTIKYDLDRSLTSLDWLVIMILSVPSVIYTKEPIKECGLYSDKNNTGYQHVSKLKTNIPSF